MKHADSEGPTVVAATPGRPDPQCICRPAACRRWRCGLSWMGPIIVAVMAVALEAVAIANCNATWGMTGPALGASAWMRRRRAARPKVFASAGAWSVAEQNMRERREQRHDEDRQRKITISWAHSGRSCVAIGGTGGGIVLVSFRSPRHRPDARARDVRQAPSAAAAGRREAGYVACTEQAGWRR
jgi:hypothetical protein